MCYYNKSSDLWRRGMQVLLASYLSLFLSLSLSLSLSISLSFSLYLSLFLMQVLLASHLSASWCAVCKRLGVLYAKDMVCCMRST